MQEITQSKFGVRFNLKYANVEVSSEVAQLDRHICRAVLPHQNILPCASSFIFLSLLVQKKSSNSSNTVEKNGDYID